MAPSDGPSVNVVWRRLDQPGHDWAQVALVNGGLRISGVALFVEGGAPARVDYVVLCGPDGRTRSAAVSGWLGARAFRRAIDVDGQGRWRLDGVEQPAVEGCLDIDLAFTPATNLLALNRLDLGIGQTGAVRSAWLRFPELTFHPLGQTYTRKTETTYAYQAAEPAPLTTDLQVAASGLILSYPGLWQAESLLEG